MHDLVTLGEVLLRLAIPAPTRFETARQLDLQVGGAEANVAAACARLGLSTAWISALPAHPWGERIRRELTRITPALGEAPRALVERALTEASTVSLDVNYRATLWSPAEARAFLEPMLARVRYLFIGQAEAHTLFGFAGSPEQTLDGLARLAPKATISLQRGEAGSTVLDGGRL